MPNDEIRHRDVVAGIDRVTNYNNL